MDYVITQQNGIKTGYITSLQVNTRNEIDNLPTFPTVGYGSDCIVIEDASVWLLNDGNEWKELGGG